MSYPRLVHALLFDLPYFGMAMRARQGVIARQAYFLPTLCAALPTTATSASILEVGSWAGASTVTWAESLRTLGCDGTVTCVDMWKPYFDNAIDADSIYVEINLAAQQGDILKLFLHNIRTSNVDRYVRYHQGDSREVLARLPDRSFNLIYIDGAHDYDIVKSDVEQSMRLVVDGGIICGDDLELQQHQVDPAEHSSFVARGKDYEFAISANRAYHPGVAAAVANAFGEVSAWNGFWAVRKQGACWTRVDLNMEGAAVPAHLLAPRDLDPELVQENYKGFNLIRYDRIYGVALIEGRFDIAEELQNGYRPFFQGETIADVIAQIDRMHPRELEKDYKGFSIHQFDRVYAIPLGDGLFDAARAAAGQYSLMLLGATADLVKEKIDTTLAILLGAPAIVDAKILSEIKSQIENLQPKLLEEQYKGFNVVKFVRVYAVPLEAGDFDLKEALSHGYVPPYEGATFEEVKAKIDR